MSVQRLPVQTVQRPERLLARLVHHEPKADGQQFSSRRLLLGNRDGLQTLHSAEQTMQRLLGRLPTQVLHVQRRAVGLIADRHLRLIPLQRLWLCRRGFRRLVCLQVFCLFPTDCRRIARLLAAQTDRQILEIERRVLILAITQMVEGTLRLRRHTEGRENHHAVCHSIHSTY